MLGVLPAFEIPFSKRDRFRGMAVNIHHSSSSAPLAAGKSDPAAAVTKARHAPRPPITGLIPAFRNSNVQAMTTRDNSRVLKLQMGRNL